MNDFWSGFVKWWQDLGASIHDWLLIPPSGETMNLLTRFIIALIVLILGRYLVKIIMRILRRIAGVAKQVNVDVSVKTFTLAVVKTVLNVLVAVFFLMILGVNFTSLAQIVSSSIVAIGLALQDLISAFASGVVLLSTKRFKTGDYIKIDHANGVCEGTVSSVGLLACTLETFENQHIVIANNQVLQGVITNYSVNPTRRLTLDMSVDYSTDIDKCKKVMREVVQSDTRILTSPNPIVAVYAFADSSITMRLICYTKIQDYWDVFYDINEKMLLAYRRNDISIPFNHFVIENYQGSSAQEQANALDIALRKQKRI